MTAGTSRHRYDDGLKRKMIGRHATDKSDLIRGAAIIAARVLLGLTLALVLSMVALAVAWGLYIFIGTSSRTTFMIMSMGSGGIGAGVAANLAWLKLDRHQRSVIALTLLICVAGGVIGGLAGYQYGANREIDCCAEPQTTPFLFTAFGAAIGANVFMYLVTACIAAARMFRLSRRAAPG